MAVIVAAMVVAVIVAAMVVTVIVTMTALVLRHSESIRKIIKVKVSRLMHCVNILARTSHPTSGIQRVRCLVTHMLG